MLAHSIQGNLYLATQKPEKALMSFRHTHQIQQSLRSFSGLVRACLDLKNKYAEALNFAKEARRAMPNNADAITLVAHVFAADPSARKKAKETFEEALKINQSCFEAILGYSKLLEDDDQVQQAVELYGIWLFKKTIVVVVFAVFFKT